MKCRRALKLGCLALGFFALAGVFALPAVAGEPARSSIVDRAIEHHGGSLFEATRTSFDVCSKSGCSSVVVKMEDGLFDYDVTATVRGRTRRVRSTNNSVELWEDGLRVAIPSEERAQALRDWAMQRVYFNFLPFRLNDPSVIKKDLGLERWFGRDLRKIRVSFAPGSSTDASDQYFYWFDPETTRLELFAYSYEVNGGGLRFRKLFDYRRVGGLLFYNQENWGIEGSALTVDLVTEQYVASQMRRVSTIELREIAVASLP